MPPVTPIIDNFDHANEGPPPSFGWVNGVIAGLVTDAQECGGIDSDNNQARRTSQYGPDCEVYVTITDPTSDIIGLFLRGQDATQPRSSYALLYNNSTTTIRLIHIDSGGSETELDSATQALSAGDSLWLYISGSTLNGYYRIGAGAWTLAVNATDSTITGAGYMWLMIRGTTARVDDFGGGTLTSEEGGGPAEPVDQALTPIRLHVLGSHRSVLEDVVRQGEDERVIYAFDFSRFGVVTELIELTVWTETSPGVRVDVSGAVFDGDFEVVDTLVICSRLQDLDRGVEYRMECSAVAGGQTLEPYVTVVGEE